MLVSSPRGEAVRESLSFARALRDADLPLGALIVNRVHEEPGSIYPTLQLLEDEGLVVAQIDGPVGDLEMLGAVARRLFGEPVQAP